jgi:DNA-binding SARP family transcriptional activator
MFELKLFGTGQARYGDEPLAGFPSQQGGLVLCYLLLNRHRPIIRERLAAVFWGELSGDLSRKHLSQALWRLRQALQSINVSADDYLLISRDSISFRNEDAYWLDIEEFETTITRYRDLAGQQLILAQAAHLEEAVDLYTGDLLEGVYEDWCLSERERLGLLHLSALSKLVLFHERNGTCERGLAYAERILAVDNTREKAHRSMMRLYWRLGDRSAALAQYKLCVQVLREELGVVPTEETQALYQQMARNQFQPTEQALPRNDTLSPFSEADESFQLLTEHALQKLNRLQSLMDETSAELHYIERLINRALLGFRRS